MSTHNFIYPFEKRNFVEPDVQSSYLNNNIEYIQLFVYHISSDADSKFPFMQILLEKIPNYMGILKEQLVIPTMMLSNDNIQSCIVNKLKILLSSIGCDVSKLDESCYKSLYKGKSTSFISTALIDISCVDIRYLFIERNSPCWFALPIEIINQNNICNIEIDNGINMSMNILEMSKLLNPDTNDYYPLPDVAYSGSEFGDTKFKSIFGMNEQTYSTHRYYSFYKNFNDAVKNGGWSQSGKPEYKFDKLVTCNEVGKYNEGGINRYALFQGKGEILYKEDIDEKYIGLILDKLFTEYDHVYLYNKNKEIMEIIVKDYDLQYPLSYYKLDKYSLGDKWDKECREYNIS